MNHIYLAARYSRREELCEYRSQLRALGYCVQARWLDGAHQISDSGAPLGNAGEAIVEGDDGGTSDRACALRARFALDDWEDVNAAKIVISFTEPPRSKANRGGRHVEFGIALANGAQTIVVGHRENIFHWLPLVEFYPTWEELKTEILRSGLSELRRSGITDKQRLDWIESKTNGSSWVARESNSGRGYRLHNTGEDRSHWPSARGSARAAIDAAMVRE